MRLRLDFYSLAPAALSLLVLLGGAIAGKFEMGWLLGLAVVALALFVLSFWRARAFIYVRSLVSGMADWHERQAEVPVVGRQPDPKLCIDVPHDPDPSIDKVMDHSETVDELIGGLKSRAARLPPLRIGPNMMWELGMSLGYHLRDLPYVGKLELAEFLTPGTQDKLVWKLGSRVVHSTAPTLRTAKGPGPGSLVIADLTVRDAATKPDFTYASRYRVAAFRDEAGPIDAPRRTVFVSEKEGAHQGHAVVSPWSAVSVLGQALRQAVHETETGPVYLALRVPKTVALALGHYLRTNLCTVPGCTKRTCEQPWTVIVTLHYDQSARAYYPWRVNRNQPVAADIAALVKGA